MWMTSYKSQDFSYSSNIRKPGSIWPDFSYGINQLLVSNSYFFTGHIVSSFPQFLLLPIIPWCQDWESVSIYTCTDTLLVLKYFSIPMWFVFVVVVVILTKKRKPKTDREGYLIFKNIPIFFIYLFIWTISTAFWLIHPIYSNVCSWI